MTNKNASRVSAGTTYRSDEAAIHRAEELAAKHKCSVHVGVFRYEDTGETRPFFFLNPAPIIDGLRLRGTF